MCCASICEEKGQSDSEQSPQANHKSQASNETSFIHNHNIQQREHRKRKKNRTFNCKFNNIDSTRQLGSIAYLPDIYSGLALGLISGWKPPNARMARDCLKILTPDWLLLAQRAGCTAFNPWHKGLPGSVWKHQLWYDLTWTFSEGPSSRDDVAPGGLTHTDESSTCLSGIVRSRASNCLSRPLLKHYIT